MTFLSSIFLILIILILASHQGGSLRVQVTCEIQRLEKCQENFRSPLGDVYDVSRNSWFEDGKIQSIEKVILQNSTLQRCEISLYLAISI